MDESVLKTIINAFLAVNDPYSSVATRNEANGYIEKFKIRNDSISYLNYILTLYMNTNTNANATNYFSVEFVHVIKYFALTLLDSCIFMRWNNQEPTAINQQIQYRNEILKYCLTQIQSDSSIRTHGGNHSHIVMTKQMQYKISAILAKFAKRQISQYWDTFVSDMLNFVQYGKDVQDMEYTIITSNICILTCTCLLEDCLLTDFNHSETLPSNRKHDIMEMVTNQLNVLLSMCYKVIYDNATLYMTSTTSPCRQIAADLVNNGLHMLIPLTAVCSTPNDLFNDDLDFSVILLQCVAIEAFQEKAILLLQSITTTHVNKLSYAILVKLLKQLPNCHICHSIETSGGDGQIPLEPSDWTDHDLYIYKLYTSSVCGLITNNLDTITNYMEIELTKPPASGISMNELLYHFFQMLSKLIGNENPSRRILCESMKSIIAWCKSDVLWKVCGQPPSLMHPGTNSQYSWFYEFIQCVCLPALHSKLKTIRYSVNKYNGEQDEEPVDDEIACMEFDNHTDYIDFQSGFKSYYRLLCNVLVKACPEMCVTYVYQQLLQLTANNVNSNATTVWCKDYKDVVGLMNMEPGHSQLQSNLNPHTLCVTTSTGRSSIVYEWNLFHLMFDALINKLPYDAFLELERGVSSTNSGSNKALGEHVTLESICRIKSMLIKTVDSLLDMVTSSSNHNGLPTVDSDALVLLEYIRCIDSTGSCLKYLIDAQRTHGSNGCDMSSYLIRTISMLLERMYYSETPLVHELNWLQMHGIGLEGTQKQIDCSRIGIGVGLSAAGVIQWLQNKLVECGSTTSSTGWNSSNSQLNGDDGVSTLIHHFEDRSQQVRKRVAGGISSILDVTITCLYSADNFELLSQLFNQIHQAILSGRLSHLQTLSMYATMVTIYQQIPNEYPNKLNILQQIVENVIQRLCHSVDVQHIVENPHYLMQAVIMEYTVKSNNNAENGDSKHAKSVYRELLDCLSIVVAICRKITPPEYSECMPQLWNRDYIGNMQHGSGTHCSAAVDTIQQLVPNLPTCVQQHLLQQTHTTPMAKISAMHDMLYKQLLFNIVWDQIYELLITLFDTFHTLFSVSMRQDPRYQDARIQHAFCFPVRLTSAYVTIPLTNASHIMHSNAFTRDIDTPIGCVDSCAMRTGLDELRVHIYTLFQYINKHKYTYLHNTHDGNRYELSALNQKHQHCLVAHLESMDNVHLTSFIKLVLDSYIYNAPPYYLNTHYYSVDQLVINNQDTVNNHQYSNSIIGQVTKMLYTHMCTRLSTIYSEIDLQNTNPIYCSNYQFCHINPELFGNIPDRQMVVDNIKLNIINELGRTYIDSLMLYSGYVTSSNSNVSHSNDDQQTVICRQHLKSRKEALYAILMHVGLSPGISHTASINTTTPSRELFYLFISNTMLLLSAEDSFVCRKCIQLCMYVVETLPTNNNTLNTLANMLPAPKTLVINDNCSQMEYDTYVSTLQAIHAQLVTDRGLIYTRHMEVCLIPLSRDVWHILFRYLVPNKPDGGTDSDKTDCYSTIHNEILDYLQDIYCRFVLHCYDSTAGANSGDQQGMDTDMYDSNGNNHTTPHSDWPRKVLMSHLAMSESGIIALEQDIMSHKSKKSRKVAFKDKIKAAKDAHMNNKLASNNPSSNANNPIDSLDMNIANAIYQATKIQNISLPGGHPACTHKQKSNVDVDVSSLFAD